MIAIKPLHFRSWRAGASALLMLSCTQLERGSDAFGSGGSAQNNGTGGLAGAGSNGLGGTLDGSGGVSGSGAFGAASGAPPISGGSGGNTGGALGSASGGTAGAAVGDAAGDGGGNAEGSAGAGGGTCFDPNGFNGLGCGTCTPTDIVSLENACTRSTCTRFDDTTRLPALGSDGKLPALPPASGSGGTGGTSATGGASGSAGKSSTGGATGGNGSNCGDLAAKGSVVYVTGSSAAKPYLQQIARQVAAQSVYVVYTSTGSCVGVDAIVNATPMRTGSAPAPATSATYWESAASNGKACDLPPAGVVADIGVSDVFAQTCPGFELAELDSLQVRDAHGPIQTMTFAVPANSKQTEISARAAYLVFGLGKDGGVLDADGETPLWDDESYIFQRSASSGTQALLASAIGVPSANFRGKSHKSSDELANALLSAGSSQASANRAIGILASDYIDTQSLRAQLRPLAYQDTEQACAVYPDSTAGARDKQNVRDGHYPLWGPLHFLYKVDGSGVPANTANRQQILDILGYLAGSKALPNGVRLIDVYGQSGLVPECAMRVSRDNDGGNIEPFAPATPCSCLFDAVATGTTACTPCTTRGDCESDEDCSFGYCEK